MKISITIDDLEFGSADALLEFAAKLKTVFSMPTNMLSAAAHSARAITNTGAASVASFPAEAPAATVAAPIPSVPPLPKAAGSDASGASNQSSVVKMPPVVSPDDAAPGNQRPASDDAFISVEPPVASVPSVPPADTEKRRRGRPKSDKPAAVEPVAEAAPVHPLAAAVKSGEAEADATQVFQTAVREHIDTNGPEHFLSVVASCLNADGKPCKSAREVPPEKRAAFLDRLAALPAKAKAA